MKIYSTPSIDFAEFVSERGFCISIEFGVETESYAKPGFMDIDTMTESTDNNVQLIRYLIKFLNDEKYSIGVRR